MAIFPKICGEPVHIFKDQSQVFVGADMANLTRINSCNKPWQDCVRSAGNERNGFGGLDTRLTAALFSIFQ